MTSRAKFERWAKRNGLPLHRMQVVERNGPRWVYTIGQTDVAWKAWSAGRRAN